MINFHSLSSISEGKHQRTVRKVKESGNIRRVFLTVPLSGKLTNGTGNRKMQSSFLFVCAQTALTLRARARVHVIFNGTIFLQPWLQMESVGQFRIAIELASSFFFLFHRIYTGGMYIIIQRIYCIYEICKYICYFSLLLQISMNIIFYLFFDYLK